MSERITLMKYDSNNGNNIFQLRMEKFTTSNEHCTVVSYKLISDIELFTEYELLATPVIQEEFFTLDVPTG